MSVVTHQYSHLSERSEDSTVIPSTVAVLVAIHVLLKQCHTNTTQSESSSVTLTWHASKYKVNNSSKGRLLYID